jgi:hypothetical protein
MRDELLAQPRGFLQIRFMSQAASKTVSAFSGKDRRRHRVFVTKNTEYHLRDGFCVAVRDRNSGDFLHGHLAIHRRVQGGLKFFMNGAMVPNPGIPREGESLFFSTKGRDLVTSPVERVERPSRELAGAYPGARNEDADVGQFLSSDENW